MNLLSKVTSYLPCRYTVCNIVMLYAKLLRCLSSVPNQELSGAKSELQGETVGVCSFYKRGGQPPYNSALRSMQMSLFVHI